MRASTRAFVVAGTWCAVAFGLWQWSLFAGVFLWTLLCFVNIAVDVIEDAIRGRSA